MQARLCLRSHFILNCIISINTLFCVTSVQKRIIVSIRVVGFHPSWPLSLLFQHTLLTILWFHGFWKRNREDAPSLDKEHLLSYLLWRESNRERDDRQPPDLIHYLRVAEAMQENQRGTNGKEKKELEVYQWRERNEERGRGIWRELEAIHLSNLAQFLT